MRMRKIAVVVTNRASWGRVKSVCKAIDEHPKLMLQMIVAASAVDLPIPYKPDAVIQCQIDGDNLQAMTLTTGLFLCQVGGALERLNPDFLYLHGDRHELSAPAIAAAYQNVKIAHGEGGETTSTIDQKVRYAISTLADIHFPVTELAKQKLIQMGCKPDNVHVVGSTALDTLKDIDLSNNHTEPYIVVLQHPNTTDPEPIEPLIEALKRIPIHKIFINPNVDAGSKAMLRSIHKQDAEFIKNLPPEEYARLIFNARCLVGNSSSFIKEASYFGIPAILVGNRQQGREIGNNVLRVPNETEAIINGIFTQMNYDRKPDYRFGEGNAAQKIVKILAEVSL